VEILLSGGLTQATRYLPALPLAVFVAYHTWEEFFRTV
jgi:hypothetical protein